MNPTVEITIDLTAQQLSDPCSIAPIESVPDAIEVEDICEFDPLLKPLPAANHDGAVLSPTDPAADPALDEAIVEIEIELTAEQMDTLLSGQTR